MAKSNCRQSMGGQLLLNQAFRLPPAGIALLLQIAAFALVIFTNHFFVLKLPLIILACCCGLMAAGLSYWVKLAKWWWIIQGLFVPALVATLALDIQPVFFLGAFFILVLVFWNTFNTQVPLYLSSDKVWQALERLLPPPNIDHRFTFMDIGSGLGGVLTHLTNNRPDGDFHGVESAPLPFLWSWLRIRLGGYQHCRVQWGDLWDCDLSRYDVVFAYLSPTPMERLWQKAKAEMKPGAVFISSTFSVPDQKPHQTVKVDDLHRSTLQIWRM
jgi:hypothetical protein